MRKAPTDAERKLWLALRGRRFAAFKFRRQVPIGPFVADFFCPARRLVVELDGGHHADAPGDARRDRWFADQGLRVLRIWNTDFLTRPDDALEGIWLALSGVGEVGEVVNKLVDVSGEVVEVSGEVVRPPSSALRAPSPARGEGKMAAASPARGEGEVVAASPAEIASDPEQSLPSPTRSPSPLAGEGAPEGRMRGDPQRPQENPHGGPYR